MNHILVVDNNIDFQHIIIKKLGPLGAKVSFAISLLDALTIIQKEEVDFISVNDVLIGDEGDNVRNQLIQYGYKGPIVILSSNPYRKERYVVDRSLSTMDFINELQLAVNNYF